MQTIVLATQKGGSGKSTLAIGLALAAIRAGHNVRLIETDSQGTVSNWQRRRPYAAPIVEPIYAAREVEQRLQSLAGGRDGDDRRYRRRRNRRDQFGHSLCRSVPDSDAAEHRGHRGDCRDAGRHQGLAQAVRLRPEPDPDPGRARLTSAENALGDEAARDIAEIVARPFIVMRNDHQDALSAGLAVCEYAPAGKSAEEIRALWQWIEARMGNVAAASDEPIIEELVETPAILPAMAALPSIGTDSALFLRAPARG